MAVTPPIFELKRSTLHSGLVSDWRINFEQFPENSVRTFASMIAQRAGPFGRVEGVPTGGLLLAELLRPFLCSDSDNLLIADDVLTTGDSITRHRNGRDAVGWVVFDRSAGFPGVKRPGWVNSLWRLEA